jgi:hypothetical protein
MQTLLIRTRCPLRNACTIHTPKAQGHRTKAQSISTNPIWSSGIETRVGSNGSSRRSRIICTQSNNLPHYKQEHACQELHKFAKTLNGISLGGCNRTHDRLTIQHTILQAVCVSWIPGRAPHTTQPLAWSFRTKPLLLACCFAQHAHTDRPRKLGTFGTLRRGLGNADRCVFGGHNRSPWTKPPRQWELGGSTGEKRRNYV